MVMVRHRISASTSKMSSVFLADKKPVTESHHDSTLDDEIKFMPHETIHTGNEAYRHYLDRLMNFKQIVGKNIFLVCY